MSRLPNGIKNTVNINHYKFNIKTNSSAEENKIKDFNMEFHQDISKPNDTDNLSKRFREDIKKE